MLAGLLSGAFCRSPAEPTPPKTCCGLPPGPIRNPVRLRTCLPPTGIVPGAKTLALSTRWCERDEARWPRIPDRTSGVSHAPTLPIITLRRPGTTRPLKQMSRRPKTVYLSRELPETEPPSTSRVELSAHQHSSLDNNFYEWSDRAELSSFCWRQSRLIVALIGLENRRITNRRHKRSGRRRCVGQCRTLSDKEVAEW